MWSLNSKIALRYYASSGFLDEFKPTGGNVHKTTAYLVGDDPAGTAKTAEGESITMASGGEQQNDPAMPADIVAAMSAIHFFGDDVKDKAVVWCETDGDPANGRYEFDCFPYSESLKAGLNRLKLFCLLWTVLQAKKPGNSDVMLRVYDTLREIMNDGSRGWSEHLRHVDSFVENAAVWLSELEQNGVELHFIDEFKNIETAMNNRSWNISTWNFAFSNSRGRAKSANDIFDDLSKRVGAYKHRGLTESYKALLFGVLDLCSEAWQ
jgi:hypothetical protein